MIKATELRLGNLLQYENEVAPVNAIWSNGNYELHSDVLRFWTIEAGDELVTGIPITPEWLERFGFEKKRHHEENYWVCFPYNVGKLMAFVAPHDSKMRVNLRVYDVEASIPIHNVHQLQNLYYALTGIELIIKK